MTSETLRPLPYDAQTESIPSDEAEDTLRVVAALKQILHQSFVRTGQFQGDVHVKSDGVVAAEFQVLPNLPEELAQGLFHRAHTYAATVRFSNSAGQANPDWVPDGRGLAIKVQDVHGERLSGSPPGLTSQDFLMVNHPVFIARNVKDYLRLEKLLVTAADQPLSAVRDALTGGHWNPLTWHWKEALSAAQIAARSPAHPATHTYYSMSPFRYGKYVAKYRAKPLRDIDDSLLAVVAKLGQDADALRTMLSETLRQEPLLFEFQVQLRTRVETMPVEDPTVEWPADESPYRTVAILLIPRQELADGGLGASAAGLEFNVWNGLEEHRPLGGINRLRQYVYPISAAWRQRGTKGDRGQYP